MATPETKERETAKDMERALNITPPSSPETPKMDRSRQKKHALKKERSERAKCYRDNIQLKGKLDTMKRKVEMLRKRLRRSTEKQPQTPRTTTRRLLRYVSKTTVKRTLVVYHALLSQLRERYAKEGKREKLKLMRNISGPILKKYRVKSEVFKSIGIHAGQNKRKIRGCLSRRLAEKVKKFYLRDDNTRLVTGLKNTVTKQKKKKQRRLLKDSLKNLHLKFLSEGRNKVSYSVFCRLRPSWVLFPSERDRNTCLCKTCDNIALKFETLTKTNACNLTNLDEVITSIVCNVENKVCMFGECSSCQYKDLNSIFCKSIEDTNVTWYEWRNTSERRMIKENKKEVEKVVSFTEKEAVVTSIGELCKRFQSEIRHYTKHIFAVRSQYNYYRKRKEDLKENELLVHIDFSENYVCKMASEVQSMHFGASKKQISLQTGILYVGQNFEQTFCTVSDNLNHGPSAFWAHLTPVLKDIRKKFQSVNVLEVFSDGPAAQYKQKANFYHLTNQPNELGFQKGCWNFFGSGHGKGIPDAIGGTLKRKADHCVRYGQDITSASLFVEKVTDSKINVRLIDEQSIVDTQTKLDIINGTMKIHQVIASNPGNVFYREISCTCQFENECQHHVLRRASVTCITELKQEQDMEKSCSSKDDIPKVNLKQRGSQSEKEFKRYLKALASCKSYSEMKQSVKKSIP